MLVDGTPATSVSACSARWHVRPWLEFHWRDWGSDSVVFELRSGQTYQVDALTAAVMACFDEGARSIGELEELIASDLGIATAEVNVAVGDAVTKLLDLRWIEATPAL